MVDKVNSTKSNNDDINKTADDDYREVYRRGARGFVYLRPEHDTFVCNYEDAVSHFRVRDNIGIIIKSKVNSPTCIDTDIDAGSRSLADLNSKHFSAELPVEVCNKIAKLVRITESNDWKDRAGEVRATKEFTKKQLDCWWKAEVYPNVQHHGLLCLDTHNSENGSGVFKNDIILGRADMKLKHNIDWLHRNVEQDTGEVVFCFDEAGLTRYRARERDHRAREHDRRARVQAVAAIYETARRQS